MKSKVKVAIYISS